MNFLNGEINFTGKTTPDNGKGEKIHFTYSSDTVILDGTATGVDTVGLPQKSEIVITPPQNAPFPTPPSRFLPTPNLTIPTQKDYNLGEFQRYFAKKITKIYI